MSAFTTQVRYICESAAGLDESTGYSSVNDVIQRAIPKVFDFDFPIYDDKYRNVLCGKILKHYYTREIGAETVGLWKLWLDTRLNEIMPYYNQLYKSALLEFNPLYDVDVTTTRRGQHDGTTDVTESSTNNDTKNITKTTEQNETNTGENTSKTTTDNTTRDMYSDTPQGALDNLENQTYLTNARKVTDGGSQDGESSGTFTGKRDGTETVKDTTTRTGQNTGKTVATNTEEYLETVQGKHGGVSYSKMLSEYRKTFINIDDMIIEELKDLFFGLW